MTSSRELEAMAELEALCISPGYIHALAFIVFRDNFVAYVDEVKTSNLLERYSRDKLIRSEMMTLVGLMIRNEIDSSLPSPGIAQSYIERTDELLLKLHHSLLPKKEEMPSDVTSQEDILQFLRSGQVMREAVFYAGESAYDFQYGALAMRKYRKDNDWLQQQRGFRIEEAVAVAEGVGSLLESRLSNFAEKLISLNPHEWTLLPEFTFTLPQLSKKTDLCVEKLRRIVDAFSLPAGERNKAFNRLSDFNAANIWPVISLDDESYIVFSTHTFLEAIYESPFYWLYADAAYRNTAQANRGEFLEEVSEEYLVRCFGTQNVHRNVLLTERDTSKKLGEVDVLVAFGDRVIILQAKTKRMTLEARKGNDRTIRNDFAKSVQDAYEQAFSCAEILLKGDWKALVEGGDIALPSIKKIYLLCVVSDHYPALSYQVSQFLARKAVNEKITAPFIMDVFLLDVMTEMLNSPLHLLSYVDRRVYYDEKIAAGHELIILAYHLKRNLWIEDDLDRLFLTDDISVDLDLALLVRRTGVKGARTPDGILTKSPGSIYRALIAQIEHSPTIGNLDLGMFLLQLGGTSIDQLNQGVEIALDRARRDGLGHDFVLGAGRSGIVVHVKSDTSDEARIKLQAHVRLRKYKMQSAEWFGICVNPATKSMTFACLERGAWVQNDALDEASKSIRMDYRNHFDGPTVRRVKVGRNDPCPCGSKKKFKKCHGL